MAFLVLKRAQPKKYILVVFGCSILDNRGGSRGKVVLGAPTMPLILLEITGFIKAR